MLKRQDKSPESGTVLVACEEEHIRGLIMDLLKRDGYRFIFAATPGDARKLAMQQRPELILLDIEFPGLTNSALIECLRLDLPDTKVLIMTGEDGNVVNVIAALQAMALEREDRSVAGAELGERFQNALLQSALDDMAEETHFLWN